MAGLNCGWVCGMKARLLNRCNSIRSACILKIILCNTVVNSQFIALKVQGERKVPVYLNKKGAALCWNSHTNITSVMESGRSTVHAFTATSNLTYILLATGVQGLFAYPVYITGCCIKCQFNTVCTYRYRILNHDHFLPYLSIIHHPSPSVPHRCLAVYSCFAICRHTCSHNVQEPALSQFLPPTDGKSVPLQAWTGPEGS